MSSTFFGLNIGASALNAYSASVNTAANNVANANTVGYSKQVTNLEANEAVRNYTYGTLGTGVVTKSITQLRNDYYDVRYWTNNSFTGQYEKKLYYMEQVENLFTDMGTTQGFTTLYTEMFNSLETLKGSAGDNTIRTQFIHDAEGLMEYFNSVSDSLRSIQSDANQEVRALVSQINSYASKISILNTKINTIEVGGRAYANDLRDQRANLIDELSKIVSIETEETPVQNTNYPDMYTGGTNFRVRLAGQLLVDNDQYKELECYSREYKVNQNDIDGLYEIRWAETKNEFVAGAKDMAGMLKAIIEVRDGNNDENLQGIVSRVNGTKVTISKPNITTIEAMNMPEEGYLTVGNRQFFYSGFSMTKTAAGVWTYEFIIDDPNLSLIANKIGSKVTVGTSVDARGIPYYQTQMNEFLRSFCRKVNDVELYGTIDPEYGAEVTGMDSNGNPMGAFFIANRPDGIEDEFTDAAGTPFMEGTSVLKNTEGKLLTATWSSSESNYYYLTSANVAVNRKSLKDPTYLATSSRTNVEESKAEIVDELLKLQHNTVIYRGSEGDEFLQYITSDISVDVNESEILYGNYYSVGSTIDTYRKSVSSVDEDEEALDLVKFQNAYNLASKVISTMNQMYDRLITQTGV